MKLNTVSIICVLIILYRTSVTQETPRSSKMAVVASTELMASLASEEDLFGIGSRHQCESNAFQHDILIIAN